MDRTKLIPGFRFHPTDVELVKYFLKRKVLGKRFSVDVIAELDIYKYAPWDLPDKSSLRTGDLEWYFFCPRGKKYGTGARMNRATEAGYWKATGKDRCIHHNNQTVGMIRTLVFHVGKAPRGERTDWVMHEFRLEDKDLIEKGVPQDSYVICKIFQKEGLGPRNGAQYGKPFNEEEWDDDEVEIDSVESFHLPALSAPVPISITITNDMHVTAAECMGSTSTCLLGSLPSPCLETPPDPNNSIDDDILTQFESFGEDNTSPLHQNEKIEESNIEGASCSNFDDILEDLEDHDTSGGLVDNWGFGEDGSGIFSGLNTSLDDINLWELIDFDSVAQQ